MKTIISLVALCLCLHVAAPVSAQSLTKSEELAYELMAESRVVDNMLTLMKDQVKLGFHKALEKKAKKLPPEYINKTLSIVEVTFEENIHELVKPMAKLNSEAFTDEELRALITFQKSPVGRKSSKIMPNLVQQGMVMGMNWGQKVGKMAVQRIKAEFKKDGVDI